MRPNDGNTEELLRQILIAANSTTANWWSENIVQLIVGFGTIALAGASVWVARKSNETAKESVRVSERSTAAVEKANQIAENNHRALLDREDLNSRRAHAAKLSRWFISAMLNAMHDADESVQENLEYSDLSVEVVELQAPFLKKLHVECHEFLVAAESWAQHHPGETNADAGHWIADGIRRIEGWAENPSSMDDLFGNRPRAETIRYWSASHPTAEDG